jgi:hypothetical protein
MRIAVHYANGMINEFDTTNFTDATPFEKEGRNILTEYQLRLDLIYDEGLLLDILWYDANLTASSKTDLINAGKVDLHYATRKAGRRLALVSKDELALVERIIKDGTSVIWQQTIELEEDFDEEDCLE